MRGALKSAAPCLTGVQGVLNPGKTSSKLSSDRPRTSRRPSRVSRISRILHGPWASKMPSWSLRGPPRSPWPAPLGLRNAVLEPPRASLVASDDSKAALRRLLATSDVILLARKPFLTHFDLILKLLGPQKPMNSFRKTRIFTFASFPLPTRPRSPKDNPKASKMTPEGSPEEPRSFQGRPRRLPEPSKPPPASRRRPPSHSF